MVRGRAYIVGEVLHCQGNEIGLKPLAFAPGKGFHESDSTPELVTISIPMLASRSIPIRPGGQIVCCGSVTSSTKLHVYDFASAASIHFRPELDCTFGWECTHLFCGSFCGWSQAVEWLPNAGFGFAIGRQVFIDHDETTLQLCCTQHNMDLVRCPLKTSEPWNPAGKIGLLGDVSDVTIPYAHRCQVNLLCTLSPPCQSWSKGGRSCGLLDDNGWAFVAGLEQVFTLQPVLACAECVDELASHAHFKLVQCIASMFGFKTLWSQIVPYHELADHCRARWLCVWIRADIAAEPLGFSLPCSIVPRVSWSNECYHFHLPKVWRDQVRLSTSEAEIYNDPQLLPPAKRARIASSGRVDAGLHGRLANPHEPLPTLCATYTVQHVLPADHLRSKGIFAVLKHQEGSYCFFDPAHFCSLFGATSELLLPSKLSLAFKGVGNAITVPHSVLCLSVGLYAVLPEHIDPVSIMRDAWEHRMTAHTAVLFEQGPFVRFMPVDLACQLLAPKVISSGQGEWRLLFAFRSGLDDFEMRVTSATTFVEALTNAIAGPPGLLLQFGLSSEHHGGDIHMSIRELAAIADDWSLQLGNVCIAKCSLLLQPLCCSVTSSAHHAALSATAPVPDQTCSVVDLPLPGSLDSFAEAETFAHILDILRPIDFVKGPHWFKVFIVHHRLPGALRIGCNQANYDALFAALRLLVLPSERFSATLAFDFVNGVSVPFRVLHVYAVNDSVDKVAVTVCVPVDEQMLHAVVRPTTGSLPVFSFQQSLYQVKQINGIPSDQHVGLLQQGSFLSLQRSHEIRAGGHHLSSGATPTLRAGSDFQARAEYMCNTHGWIAADELWSITQNLMFMQDQYKFTAPVYWNQADSDFTLSPFGELYLFNNTTNVICVLIDDHWAAIEIRRNADAAHLHFVQLPQHLHTAATCVVARLLDIAPHRLTASSELEAHLPHLCGWRLIQRWVQHFDLDNDFQPETFAGVADRFHDIITMTMECALEDWRTYNAPQPLIQLAALLRKKFLIYLARRESQQNPLPQKELLAAFPVRLQPLTSTLPTLPPTPEETATDRISARLDHMLTYSGWMASDEMDFSLDVARIIQPGTLFCAPAIWNLTTRDLEFPNGLFPEYGLYDHIIWLVIHNNHWLQFECYRRGSDSIFIASVPVHQRGIYVPLVQLLLRQIGLDHQSIAIDFVDQTMPRDLCGYYLLANLFYRLGLQTPPPLDLHDHLLAQGVHALLIARVRREARNTWIRAEGLPDFAVFAANIRDWFLLRVKSNRFPDVYYAAGAVQEMQVDAASPKSAPAPVAPGSTAAPSTSPKAVDHVWVNDPWGRKPPRPAQCKWEDLRIQTEVPFLGSDGSALQQTHRLQLGPNRGGIVLLTKSFLSEVMKQIGTQDLAVLLPVTDNLHLPHLAAKIEGPYEVAMYDEAAKLSYKRLAQLIVLHGKCTYKLPEPKCKITTQAMCELVLEVDSRLCTKVEIEKIKESPIASFRDLVSKNVAAIDSSVVLYGFRSTVHPGASKGDFILQCIIKAPQPLRVPLLEASGASILLVRDFLERGQSSADTTILPRFWMPTISELHSMRISLKDAPGQAGIIVARRGLAPRVWISKLGEARKTLLAADGRIVDANRHVIPRMTYELAGWPAGTDAANIVRSTLDSTGVAVLPMRTYRSAGVHVWVIACEKEISTAQFSIDINGHVHQIIIQQVLPSNVPKGAGKNNPKGSGKGKKKTQTSESSAWSGPLLVPKVATDDTRLDNLEARFDRLESRQQHFEGKVDSKFDSISDALRQLLANTNPRAREPSGETPPSKAHKGS